MGDVQTAVFRSIKSVYLGDHVLNSCNHAFRFIKYRIYSINRPGRLLNFWTLRVGAYSRWSLIRGGLLFEAGRLLNFHHFQQVKYVYFATKREEVTKQGFCKIL